MTDAARRVLALSYQLDGVSGVDADAVVGDALAAFVPADSVRHFWGHPLDGSMRAWSSDGPLDARTWDGLVMTMPLDPVYLDLMRRPEPSPRRLSDLVPGIGWSRHPAYVDYYSRLGFRHLLAANVVTMTPRFGDGWFVYRGARDFTDDEVALTARVIPLLGAVTMLRSPARWTPSAAPSPLTQQETRILGFVAEGLTAAQIGLVLRISHRTVRKHLEHCYDKLGCHSQLQAVRAAERLGVLARRS